MFYHGGMTLGYLTPPTAKEKAKAVNAPFVFASTHGQAKTERDKTDKEREYDQDLARAFITPWHLFY